LNANGDLKRQKNSFLITNKNKLNHFCSEVAGSKEWKCRTWATICSFWICFSSESSTFDIAWYFS